MTTSSTSTSTSTSTTTSVTTTSSTSTVTSSTASTTTSTSSTSSSTSSTASTSTTSSTATASTTSSSTSSTSSTTTTTAPLPTMTYTATYSTRKMTKPRILSAELGDGYRTRAPDGINYLDEEWMVVFVKVKATIDAIEAFLENRGGYKAFIWTDPRSAVDKIWTCSEWERGFHGDKVDKLTCKFRKEYDLYG